MSALAFVLCHFGETVAIAKLDKALKAELERRAEYAMRYQIHAPSQWHCFGIVSISLIVTVIYCLG